MERIRTYFVPRAKAFVALLVVAAVSTPAHAQWTVTYLHPANSSYSLAWGGAGAQVVVQAGIGGTDHALLWNASAATFVDLNPVGATASAAFGISGTQQVGAADNHAGIWSGTAASWVDLNPAGASQSTASGISGTRQSGTAMFTGGVSHAGMWSGTAASWVDLHPTSAISSAAYGIAGSQVAGSVEILVVGDDSTDDINQATIWNGSAPAVVNLNPSGYFSSIARATTGTHQVGSAYVSFPFDHPAHAAFWSGTAASFVDLNPAGAIASEGYGVFGDYQVGYSVFSSDTFGPSTASLWNGSAASWEDLSLALTGSWSYTQADSIWSDGATLYVAGFGINNSANRTEALLWSRPIAVPEPGELMLAGLGFLGLCALRLSLPTVIRG